MAVKNQKSLEKYQMILNEVRDEYPNKPFHWQQQKASEIMHSGHHKPKSKKITGKKTVGRKAPVIVFEQEGKRSRHKKQLNGHVSSALKIQSTINKLEETRKAQPTKQMKDIIQRAINLEHQKLRKIDLQMRSKRA